MNSVTCIHGIFNWQSESQNFTTENSEVRFVGSLEFTVLNPAVSCEIVKISHSSEFSLELSAVNSTVSCEFVGKGTSRQ